MFAEVVWGSEPTSLRLWRRSEEVVNSQTVVNHCCSAESSADVWTDDGKRAGRFLKRGSVSGHRCSAGGLWLPPGFNALHGLNKTQSGVFNGSSGNQSSTETTDERNTDNFSAVQSSLMWMSLWPWPWLDLYIHTSIYPYIYISIHQYIHTSIYPCIYISIHLYIHVFIYPYIYISMYPYIDVWIYRCMDI